MILARMLQVPLRIWHRFLAPALPPMCRFYPSCAAYAIEVLETHSLGRALRLILWRLMRCHPFHPGGYDPVPEAECCRHEDGAAEQGALGAGGPASHG